MVNTFITTFSKGTVDYAGSAANLDVRRSLKQCVEAYQIIRILESVKVIANYFFGKSRSSEDLDDIGDFEKSMRYPPPVTKEETKLPVEERAEKFLSRIEWLSRIRKFYESTDKRLVFIQGEYKFYHVQRLPVVIPRASPSSNVKYELYYTHGNEADVYVTIPKSMYTKNPKKWSLHKQLLDNSGDRRGTYTLIYDRERVCITDLGDRIFTLGFSQHAIVKMWLGYEDSLKYYVNQHIINYLSRKTKSGRPRTLVIPLYEDIPPASEIVHPWWITDYDGVVISHRVNLLRKELVAGSEPHYWLIFNDVPNKFIQSLGYVWPGSLPFHSREEKLKVIISMMSSENIDILSVCAPINKKQIML